MTFAQGVFSPNGQKLLNAGVALNSGHLRAVARSGVEVLFIAEDAESLERAGLLSRVNQESLSEGDIISADLVSVTGGLVLEAGERVESHHLDAVQESGDVFVGEDTPDDRRHRVEMGEAEATSVEATTRLSLRVVPADTDPWRVDRPVSIDDWLTGFEAREKTTRYVAHLRTSFARLLAGIDTPAERFTEIVDDLIEQLTRNPRRFTSLAELNVKPEEHWPGHALNVAVYSIATAAAMRWPEHWVRTLGAAALVCDVGMLALPQSIRESESALTDLERSRMQQHPTYSLAMLRCVDGLGPLVKLAVLQHHERENGSGYARGLRGDSIADLARVLAVVDTYTAIAEPRRHRAGIRPSVAVEMTLQELANQRLHRDAVGGFVKAIGAYPVGSEVVLSDGRPAIVIASNPQKPREPVVVARGGERLDMSATSHGVRITQSVAGAA